MSGGRRPDGDLRRGWTTGACATAAAKAAFAALVTGRFPDPVTITLPGGATPAFALSRTALSGGAASASVVKDAGDDPDVTHGAEITTTIALGRAGSGVAFRAGEGVGTVTLAGLPLAVGEPAINPVPRRMIQAAIEEVALANGVGADAVATISVGNGAALAEKTWNPRLGIVGGLSILGTTGIVVPYSCASWIHSIHRGVDVARAAGFVHLVGATGRTSEAAAKARYGLDDLGLIDMGDFAGGLLKYVKAHPVPHLTIAGGFAKLAKLAQGALDLHSARSQVALDDLAGLARQAGGDAALSERIAGANTANEALAFATEAGVPLADRVAAGACVEAAKVLGGAPVAMSILVVDRNGTIVAEAGRA